MKLGIFNINFQVGFSGICENPNLVELLLTALTLSTAFFGAGWATGCVVHHVRHTGQVTIGTPDDFRRTDMQGRPLPELPGEEGIENTYEEVIVLQPIGRGGEETVSTVQERLI